MDAEWAAGYAQHRTLTASVAAAVLVLLVTGIVASNVGLMFLREEQAATLRPEKPCGTTMLWPPRKVRTRGETSSEEIRRRAC